LNMFSTKVRLISVRESPLALRTFPKRSLQTFIHSHLRSHKSSSRLRRETYLYACKIKETTNGRWRSARSQAWETLQVVTERSFAPNGEVDEQNGVAQDGQDQAQRKADKEEAALATKERRSPDRRGALEIALPCRRGALTQPFCIMSITSFNGSALTLLVPVKG
jgi:hypothetical protein